MHRNTTFLRPRKLRDSLGVDLTVATETFQHTGSFKFRAAYNVASRIPNDHLIAASSGNFGQALAYACELLGKRCHIVMPETSARVKIAAVRSYGAAVDLIDIENVGREERVDQLMKEYPGAYRASAYDDSLVIEGNSTLGAEIAEHERNFDNVVVPVGGGGLISGISKGLCAKGSNAVLIGAEPAAANDAARSLAAGKIVRNESEPQTIADGARTISLGVRNWEIIKAGVSRIMEVSEEGIVRALRSYFELANLKVEPTGALSLAAIMENPGDFKGKSVCLVVSGGNVDPALYAGLLV